MKNVLIIGIDGCPWSILDKAISRGYMPSLASLCAGGSSGVLKSTVPAITPAAWGSFQTGVCPALNGVFDFCYFDRQSREKKYVSSNMLQKTIWQFVSEAAGAVSAVNVPMTYPPYPINGYMVSGITTPSERSEFTYPPDFKKEILKEIPDYHIFTLKNTQKDFIHKDIASFIDELRNIIDRRTKLALMTLRRQKHNLFMVHFQATDVLQHLLWPYLDENHELFSENRCDYILKEFYHRLDENIKTLGDEFEKINGSDFMTLILSDHGFEAHKCRVNIGNWLLEQGYTKHTKKNVPVLKRITRALRVGRTLKKLIGEEKTCNLETKAGLRRDLIDWGNTAAVSMGRSGEGYIYVLENNPEKKNAIIENLTGQLFEITHEGQKVASEIVAPTELYNMKCSDIFPDLIIIPAPGYSFTGDVKQGCPLFDKVDVAKDFHIGKHHQDGIIIAAGGNIRKSKIKADIIDVMPTVLSYMGISFPNYVQGRVMDIFTQNAQPARYDLTPKTGGSAINSDEDADIANRLNDLGYM